MRRVAEYVLDDEAPVRTPLRKHSAAAKRRRITRGLIPFWFLLALAVLFRLERGETVDKWIAWFILPALAFFLLLSWDRIRNMGHNIVGGRLVTSSGSLQAKRSVLDADGIIGWQVSQTPFQRWSKVATVRAATPAGQGVYGILDMQADESWALAEAITPGITAEWGTIISYPRDGGAPSISAPATSQPPGA